jgi:hypothetical protein
MAAETAAGIRDIPRRCICAWDEPIWGRPPHLRRWTLARTDPLCLVHGTPETGEPS